MNKSNLFKAAHKLAKQVIKAGDNYRVTFGACIKAIKKGFVMVSKIKQVVEFAIKKGALNQWSKGDMHRAYVGNFDYNGGLGLSAKLQELGISADNAYFDFATEEFQFKNLRKYNSRNLDMKSFEGSEAEMTKVAVNILKKFLNSEMKK